jgi:hypothetical protein
MSREQSVQCRRSNDDFITNTDDAEEIHYHSHVCICRQLLLYSLVPTDFFFNFGKPLDLRAESMINKTMFSKITKKIPTRVLFRSFAIYGSHIER